jgi:transmembrane sensor
VTSWLAHEMDRTRGSPIKASSKSRTRATWAVAAAASLACAAAVEIFMIDSSRATSFETPIGGNTTVHLADGSVIELGGHSRCDVRFDRSRRMVTLVRGEALFHVSKDPNRPFRVHAGSANVEAVGTEFDIRRTADRVVVSVVEGRVLVQPVEPLIPISWVNWTYSNGRPLTLGAGNQTTVSPTGIESQKAIADIETTLSWRHGRLAFEREPLHDVIEEVNRYSAVPIALDEARMGDILITGTVSGSDIEGWIMSLKSALGLRAERDRDRILLKRSVPSQ